MKSTAANLTVTSLPSIPSPATLSIPESATTPPKPVVKYFQQDIHGCPSFLTNPPEVLPCHQNLSPEPETYYRIADPSHPTPEELAAIPGGFPGVDRNLLLKIALNDTCVQEFLKSGGEIVQIAGQPFDPSGKETSGWPPALYTYSRINCTEMYVTFDIDPKAGNISGIIIESWQEKT